MYSLSIPSSQDFYRHPGYIHYVLLQGLQYDTVYFYQFGNDVDGWSQTFQFTAK